MNTLSEYLFEKKYTVFCSDEDFDIDGTIQENTRKNISRRLLYLRELLDLEKEDMQSDSNPILCILSELVYEYYEAPPFNYISKEQARVVFNDISTYGKPNQSATIRDHGHIKHDTEIIVDFFLYFVKSKKWEEQERYSSRQQYLDTLEYLNSFAHTITFWHNTRTDVDERFRFDSDIKQFALALYDRNKLPDAEKYMDVCEPIADIVYSVKIHDTDE